MVLKFDYICMNGGKTKTVKKRTESSLIPISIIYALRYVFDGPPCIDSDRKIEVTVGMNVTAAPMDTTSTSTLYGTVSLSVMKLIIAQVRSRGEKTGGGRDSRWKFFLGLTPPVLAALEQNYKPIQEQSSPVFQTQQLHPNFPFSTDSFADAISDFERTLQRSKNKLSNNLPDVTAVSDSIRRVPSVSSMSSTSGSSMTVLHSVQDGNNRNEFDAANIESCFLSPIALQNIREQMALSLERTRQLEEQVKLLPELKPPRSKHFALGIKFHCVTSNMDFANVISPEQQSRQLSHEKTFKGFKRSQDFIAVNLPPTWDLNEFL
ncbi:hypothetical protein NQ315_009001 [Exocentrus adspersus]|uniref:Uncharacterized protein n=1 Tax=Exocentrus adspersus TaxID=1586481 RepID=A0AAV8VG47_9CUCU|nr:hypothetical protein NQ315_009001 [Exocentrus adspersus]